MTEREKLPGKYEKQYRSAYLKAQITDICMWALIPGVDSNIASKAGRKRLQENDLLFTFIDQYLPDIPFAFEPNMRDGRFVYLPKNVCHQGIGICVSEDFPELLEVGHFWYPSDFTKIPVPLGMDQVYVSMFCARPEQLVKMVKEIYGPEKETVRDRERYCTFPFTPDNIVTLDGYFMDQIDQAAQKIRTALKDEAPQIRRNGEGLIDFMKHYKKSM